jgi:hypothetical protein
MMPGSDLQHDSYDVCGNHKNRSGSLSSPRTVRWPERPSFAAG